MLRTHHAEQRLGQTTGQVMNGNGEKTVDEAALDQALIQALAAIDGTRLLVDQLDDGADDETL
jgi:hypothetical protein